MEFRFSAASWPSGFSVITTTASAPLAAAAVTSTGGWAPRPPPAPAARVTSAIRVGPPVVEIGAVTPPGGVVRGVQ